nr:hypothetical protein [Tanacetum cinerariifolium]
MLHMLRVEMVINSPWMLSKNWLVQKQTDLGQTTTGKESSNPFMVGSLPKRVNTPRSDEDRLKLMELMVFLLQKGVYGEIGITAARLSSYCSQANSDAAEGFEQIIDFLSGSYIHYALTFWNTASVKRSGDVTRLQALVDKKKIVISEAVIREILQLNDAEGINQVGDLSTHTTRFISPALTQNVFANMRRVGKGFSGVETPLFEEMLVAVQPAEEGLVADQVPVDAAVAAAVEAHVAEDVSHDAIPSPPPHVIPSPSQEPSSPPQQQQSSPQAPPQDAEFPTQLQHVLNVCFALSKCVENLETNNDAQKLEIVQLKARVKKLEKANKIKSSKLRHLRKVGISRRVESSDDMEDVFNQGRMIADMDMNEGIKLVKDAKVAESKGRNAAEHAEKPAKIYNLDLDHSSKEDDSEVQKVVEVVTTAKLITEVVTAAASQPTIPATAPTVVAAYTRGRKGVIIRDPEEELPLKTSAETPKVKDKGKGILVETPKPMKKKDQIELDVEYARKLHEEINKDDVEYQGMKKRPQTESEARKNMMIYLKNTAGYKMDFFKGMSYADISQKATKRRKLNEEAQEAEALKKQLEIVNDEDDDVFTKATPLRRKVPVVDYEIVMINNKPRYPLSKFTLEQLVNVARLQVEEESEMSLELLRFTRQQLQEYQQG